MKSESFIGSMSLDNPNAKHILSRVPDYRDISESDFNGLTEDDDISIELLRHNEVYLDEKARLLQDKINDLEQKLSDTLSNGEKVELQYDIEAVQAELNVVNEDRQIPTLTEEVSAKGDPDGLSERHESQDEKLQEMHRRETEERERVRLYDNIYDDPAYRGYDGEITRRTNQDFGVRSAEEAGSFAGREYRDVWRNANISEILRSRNDFVESYPEKADGYANKWREYVAKNPQVAKMSNGEWEEWCSVHNDAVSVDIYRKIAGTIDYIQERNLRERNERLKVESEMNSETEMKSETDSNNNELPPVEGDGGLVEVPPVETVHSEHWQLKRAMREAKDAYLTKLDESAQKRGVLKKWIGFGRKNLDPEVQSAYDEFMAANKAYYQYANNSGRYDKIDAWLRSRERASGGTKEVVSVDVAVAERHLLRPARERLALQEREMPPAVRKLLGKIAANPKLKWGLLGASIVSTAGGALAGMVAGKLTKWGLEKTYIKGKESEHQLDREGIIEMISSGKDFEFDKIEDLYYTSALAIDTARVRANVAGFAVGAATTAGVGYANWNDILSQSGVTGTEVVNQTPPTAEELGMVKPTETMTGQVPAQPEMVAVEAEPTIPVRTPEPTVVAPENVVENVTTPAETTIDTTSGTSEVLPTPENEVTTPVQIEDQDIAAVDGDLSDSVTNYERPAVDGSNVESAATPENLVLDKIHISKDGNIGLIIPEGQTLDVDNVVGPFAEEASHTVEANQDLVDVMVNRLMEGVKAGKIELDPNMTEQDLRYMLLEKLPELKQPDEVLWFQRTATPGLSAEVWQEIGVPGGDPLNIPPGTEVDMEILLNEAMGFESDASTSIDTPAAPIEETGGSVELPKEVEQISEQPLNQKVEFSAEEPAVGRTFATNETMISPREEIFAARIDLDSARVAERLFGYQPQMSSELAKAVMTVGEGVNQNDFVRELYKQTLASYRAGDISLPVDVIRGVQSNPSAINAFVDRNAAEFAEFNPFITKRALDLTIDQWKDLGFSSGDPDKIMPGDTIQTGKLIKLILENAAGKINSKFHI
ncbi:MAG: hypothetical protein KBC35_00790 [Candidatus Pacebacteria bacterium]|nr:hypothetical protein [Candidatus Paceibacterota bacterium]